RIEFQNVWFAYDDEDWVLKDVSFTIEPGQVVALVGRTGAGKTTIANLIMRFYDVSRGRVLLDGVDVRDWDLTTFRNSVAFVPQDGFLFSTTIEENIRLGRAAVTRERCVKAVREVCADEFIEKLPQGYETVVLERGDNFSAGQKQLISLARSLASNPSLLILDEATSAVDVETEKRIQRTLERVMQERTAVVIAHRLSTIHGADRIIVLHHGEIREQGSHAELIAADGIYSRLYGLQFPVTSFLETRRAT
ncbi:MAG TPA: ATP-binding cassette domain-containing protein, partial [Pyrinomonadaceae bacterium]|nr:ATP-binding cassette domain-containing protein [Pyrinomonadaceae bacterium]